MRAAILVLAALAATTTLAGCKNNDQLDQTQNVDENLTAENFVSNDVTAIDAVTGDAANMAADSDILFGNLEAPDENAGNEATSPSPGKPSSKPSTEKNQSSESTTANTTAKSVETNAE